MIALRIGGFAVFGKEGFAAGDATVRDVAGGFQGLPVAECVGAGGGEGNC